MPLRLQSVCLYRSYRQEARQAAAAACSSPAAFLKGIGLRIYGNAVSAQRISVNLGAPLVLNVRKVARRDKHFVAYFLAALLASLTRCLYRCPKSLKVVSWYWSFCHSYSPYYILLFPFLLGYVYIVLSVSQNNSYIYMLTTSCFCI